MRDRHQRLELQLPPMGGREWQRPSTYVAVAKRPVCTGNCNQGRACDCVPDLPEFAPIQPIQSVEEEHPLLWLLYGVLIVTVVGISIVVRHAWISGWFA